MFHPSLSNTEIGQVVFVAVVSNHSDFVHNVAQNIGDHNGNGDTMVVAAIPHRSDFLTTKYRLGERRWLCTASIAQLVESTGSYVSLGASCQHGRVRFGRVLP